MNINQESQAIANLKDMSLDFHLRENALHYLAEHPSPEGLAALVEALQYKEFAIRWGAATILAQLGPQALVYVLQALKNPSTNTANLREGVIHILHYGSNLAQEPVYRHKQVDPVIFINPGGILFVGKLLEALKGPAADIQSMKAADDLLVLIKKMMEI